MLSIDTSYLEICAIRLRQMAAPGNTSRPLESAISLRRGNIPTGENVLFDKNETLIRSGALGV